VHGLVETFLAVVLPAGTSRLLEETRDLVRTDVASLMARSLILG
jgi:hypothetical protein